MFIKKTSSLSNFSSEELMKELATRKNSSILKMNSNQQFQVKNGQKRIKEKGPAIVLVIREGA
ncbi:BC1881 family protein [Natronincola ferrireducens]|uniref:Uncharacterized protein n=1 Tax=Natronincola ferrireducens TaxID=393762 RepID=A0A1G9I388_9FIRM|nr:BC1881 family protein [Natronincola ferrireducens]SDL19374.1 hypothetical protein SAMN05660472_02777 [Natronincola ferrireducens]